MSSKIFELIKQRDSYLYKFKKNGCKEDFKTFSEIRNNVQRQIRKAKSEYFSNKVEENKFYPKKLWQNLKSLGYKNQQKSDTKIVLNIDGENSHDSVS
jgi:Holliday junction resolvasome RuvABC DNA-binding subunit